MLIRQGQSIVVALKGSVGTQLEFLWVNAGSFIMGSPESESGRDESERQFLANISQGFWLSKNLVIQDQWQTVMGNNPSSFQQNGTNRPVENVNWFDTIEFCRRLENTSQISLPIGYGFSLPTEAQWEYACRAGTATRYFFGESDSDIDRYVWHSGNSNGETHPIGLKESNPWGFHDMYGNVGEWCYDEFAEYPPAEATDWIGRTESEWIGHTRTDLPLLVRRVVRGGGYGGSVADGGFRSACRSEWRPESKRPWCGFRVSIRIVSTPNHQLTTAS